MCGITGIIIKKGDLDFKIYIDKLLNYQDKRGPDASGNFISHNIALGHNRLAIQDLDSRSNQPFVYKNLVMVFNGEIYNYVELKSELIKNFNEIFTTNSDTEVLIKLFYRLGIEKTLEKINGMFCIGIYNKDTNDLFIIRDRIGIKQCYIYEDDNKLIFSSTPASIVKTLNDLENKKFNLNKTSLFHYLSGGICLTTETMFEEIKGINTGSYIKINVKNYSKNIKKWWNLSCRNGNIENIINKAVEIRNRSDAGGYLLYSGGTDSSVISKFSNKIDLLTLDAGEYEFAKNISLELGLENKLHKIPKDFVRKETNNFIQEQRKIINFIGIPIRASFLMTLCGKYIKTNNDQNEKKNKIVLSGIGGNELFYGHRRMKLDESGIEDHIKNIYHYLSQIEPLDNDYKEVFLNFKETLVEKVLKTIDLPKNIYRSNIHRWIEINTFLLNDLLVNSDAIFMYYSLESRVPFLDHNVIECIMNTQPEECFYNSEEIKKGCSWKNYTKNNKKQLRDILKDDISEENLIHAKYTYELQRHRIGPMYYNLCDKFLQRKIINWNGPWTKFNATLIGNLELWFQEFDIYLNYIV